MDSDVANEIAARWEVEEILDEDFLFMRVHQNYLDDDGEPIPARSATIHQKQAGCRRIGRNIPRLSRRERERDSRPPTLLSSFLRERLERFQIS